MNPKFWPRLCGYTSADIFNPWADYDPLDVSGDAASDRRISLGKHFARDAKYLLIGEAPGYRGCHFSGIPFTCEKQLYEGIVPGIPDPPRITTRELPWSEGSASIVWSTLYQIDIAESTVMWNAFPWHPHVPGNPLSNRTPTPRELVANADILAMVLEAFPNARRIAVGKCALRTMQSLGVTAQHEVRHPSMGGSRQFKEQMREIAGQVAAEVAA